MSSLMMKEAVYRHSEARSQNGDNTPRPSHQYGILRSRSHRTACKTLDTSVSSSGASINASNNTSTLNNKDKLLVSANGEDISNRSSSVWESHANCNNSQNQRTTVLKHETDSQKHQPGLKQSMKSSKRKVVVIQHQRPTNVLGYEYPPHPKYGKNPRNDREEKENNDSRKYIGIYPHSSSSEAIPQIALQPNLLSAIDSLSLVSRNEKGPSSKDIVFNCVQENTKRAKNESMMIKRDKKKRTEEWLLNQDHQGTRADDGVTQIDQQPRLSSFCQALNEVPTILIESEEIYSSEGTSRESGQQSDIFTDDSKSLSDYLGTKASSASILYEFQEGTAFAGNVNEQDDIGIKCEGNVADHGGRPIAESPGIQQLAANPTHSNTTTSQPSQEHASFGPGHTSKNKPNGNRKRKIGQINSNDRSDNDDNDDSDGENPRRLRAKTNRGGGINSDLLACPYFQHDSRKYSGREWRGCFGPGWPNGTFIQPPSPTEILREIHIDGFDLTQEAKLRSRKREITSLPEADKWKLIYTILFPHVDQAHIPSPYYRHTESISNVLNDYEEFVFKEISGNFRATLEHELEHNVNITEVGSKQRAVEWFMNTHLTLLRAFRNSSRPSSSTPTALEDFKPLEANPPDSGMAPRILSQGLQHSLDIPAPLSTESAMQLDGNEDLFREPPDFFEGFNIDDCTYQFMTEQPSDSAYGSTSS
ncbi:hypothetical protein F4806DRAFT_499717 [Annulohypoxylon nitens]|nr:hypothetical protein F4806DRAFT_499717 [Annulohypoxylon nitens]